MWVQEVDPLIRNRGILGIAKNWGASSNRLGAESNPTNQKLIRV